MPALRPRIIVVASYGFSARYLLPTGLLDRLAAVADTTVALSWDDPELVEAVEATGATAARLPDPEVSHEYRRLERFADLNFDHRLKSPTTPINRRWRRAVGTTQQTIITTIRQAWGEVVFRVPGVTARREAAAEAMAATGTNVDAFIRWLEPQGADAVISLTPYHRSDHLTLLAARTLCVPTLASIISFDNPTTRGRMPVLPDRILVWNRFNCGELLRSYPGLSGDDVRIIGAPQFDLHQDRSLVVDEADWRRQLGLPPDRPVLLYAAGPELLFPGEERLVAAIAAAIDEGRIPGSPVVLVRGHPAEAGSRWEAAASDHVVVDPGWGRVDGGRAWPSSHDTALQISTLTHAVVHLSICSSMAIDGAAVDRPTVAPVFIPGIGWRGMRRLRAFYRQEHWAPIAASGAVDEVTDLDALVAAVTAHLADPSLGREARADLVTAVLTHGDGESCRRLTDEIVELVGVPRG
ncbi:hypothetical protein [Aquihabitans sp. McL0605]|uniref:hypothetical protein n=1 Tax=Aquihabitans sp. McL0605 TaxID=3415671 RepID=UPI003CE7BDCA